MAKAPAKPSIRPDVVVDAVLMRQVAAVAITGAGYKEIADKLNLSRVLVRRICNDPKFKELIEKTGENELVPVLIRARTRMSKLVDKAIDVVEKQLDQDNLNAARMVFEATGLSQREDKQVDTHIQVILPGQRQEKVIDVMSDGTTESDE